MSNAKLRIRRSKRTKFIQKNSALPRILISKTNRFFGAVLIKDGKVAKSFSTRSLLTEELAGSQDAARKSAKNKVYSEKLGEQVARHCLDNELTALVFDRAGYRYHGCIQVFADTLRRSGITI